MTTLNKCPWCGKSTPNANLCNECAEIYANRQMRKINKDEFIHSARYMVQELQFHARTADLAILASQIQNILDLIITYIEEN